MQPAVVTLVKAVWTPVGRKGFLQAQPCCRAYVRRVPASRRPLEAGRKGRRHSRQRLGVLPKPRPFSQSSIDGMRGLTSATSLRMKISRRVELTRSKLLSGTVGHGATLPYGQWQLRHGLGAFPDGPCRPGRRPTATSTAARRQNVADQIGAHDGLGRWCTLPQTHYLVLGTNPVGWFQADEPGSNVATSLTAVQRPDFS
jgi:hypothetical protein